MLASAGTWAAFPPKRRSIVSSSVIPTISETIAEYNPSLGWTPYAVVI
jgi:hypothetical protein